MDIEFSSTDDAVNCSLEGRLDAMNAAEVQQKVVESLDSGKDFILDFSKLNYISSAGLRVLIIVAKQQGSAGKKLEVRHAQPQIREVLEMSGFDKILNLK